MNNHQQIFIRLTDIYECTISSRASITSIFDKFRSQSNLHILLDFSQIAFISRSSAQQLILEKKYFETNKIKFSYLNIEPQVNKILELAEHKLQRQKIDVINLEFNSKKERMDFMFSF